MKKNWLKIGLLAGLCLVLSGCLFRSPSDLYEQPAKSAGYEQLNRTIADIKSGLETEYGTSVENAVIVTGNHTATHTVQKGHTAGLDEENPSAGGNIIAV